MKKSSTAKATKSAPGKKAPTGYPSTFKDRNLSATSPTKEQFEPTDQTPVSQHKRMAGAA